MKKLFLTLVVILNFSAVITNESMAEVKQGCDCGTNCCYTYENGVLTLSREDNTQPATIKDGMFAPMWGNTWTEFNMTEVTIPEGFTSIGKHAFHDQKISSLTMPSSMEIIDDSAFESVSTLTSLTLNNGLKEIGWDAFGWTGVNNLILPESIEIIDKYAFSMVDNIIIPASVNTDDWAENPFNHNNVVCLGTMEDCLDKLGQYIPPHLGGTCTQNCPNFSLASSEQCNLSENYGWSGSGCVRKDSKGEIPCDNELVFWNNACVTEYPFAKKRWTPAEANKWLNDDDNTIIITFKK